MSTFKTKIDGKQVHCDSNLVNYRLFKKPSSHVSYFGTAKATKQLFVQYTNGKCFVTGNVPEQLLTRAESAPSIGKFLHAEMKDYKAEQVSDTPWITEVKEDENK